LKQDLKQSRFMPTRSKSGAQHGEIAIPTDRYRATGCGRNQGSDPSAEMASLRERLMRALAETENTRASAADPYTTLGVKKDATQGGFRRH
jgi:hypothetical protein